MTTVCLHIVKLVSVMTRNSESYSTIASDEFADIFRYNLLSLVTSIRSYFGSRDSGQSNEHD